MIKIIEILNIDTDNFEVKVLCSDNKTYLFRLNRMFDDDVPVGMQNTWKLLIQNDNFSRVKIIYGDLVWEYCEILHSEIPQYLEVTK